MSNPENPNTENKLPAKIDPKSVSQAIVSPEQLIAIIHQNENLNATVFEVGTNPQQLNSEINALAGVINRIQTGNLTYVPDKTYLSALKSYYEGVTDPIKAAIRHDLRIAIAASVLTDLEPETTIKTRRTVDRVWANASAGMDNEEGDEFILTTVVPTLSPLEQRLLWRSFGTARKIELSEYTDEGTPPDTNTCSETVMARYIMSTVFGPEAPLTRRYTPTGEMGDRLASLLQAVMDRHDATLDHVGRDEFLPIDIINFPRPYGRGFN